MADRKARWMKWRWVAMAVLIAAGLDFNAFANRVAALDTDGPLQGDAIVVLTGGSGLRIAAAMDRLAAGEGERLLISGVHPDVTLDDLSALAGGSAQLYECCVDIDHRADSTRANADEVQAWARAHDYRDIILVTSDYHIPRSLILMRRGSGDLVFHPAPVETAIDPALAWQDWHAFRGTLTEWAKWRVTQGLSHIK